MVPTSTQAEFSRWIQMKNATSTQLKEPTRLNTGHKGQYLYKTIVDCLPGKFSSRHSRKVASKLRCPCQPNRETTCNHRVISAGDWPPSSLPKNPEECEESRSERII
ncbi:hypothetical protein TNCV_389531 [Trichonephila clavipes]|nr:hypothetical protein TNCV_389531 [Trichonephila clavipes]